MANKNELNRLRNQVRQAHKNATAKASRLRAKGIEVSGTRYDPRKPLANVKRYTASQLNNQLGKLQAFNSRGNAPVPGQSGVLDPELVRRYKQAERNYNRRAIRQYDKVKGLPALGRGMTVGEADKVDRPTDRTRASGEAVMRPFEPVKRKLTNVADNKALQALTEQLERRRVKGYRKEVLDRQRSEFMRMVTDIGNIADVKAARELTDEQFNVLFNYNASVVNDIAMSYEVVKLKATGKAEESMERIDESARVRISNAIKWAGTL